MIYSQRAGEPMDAVAVAPDPMTAARKHRLASRCLLCRMALTDSASVELGIGPKCRKRAGVDGELRGGTAANELTAQAAILAEDGDVAGVLAIADRLEDAGFGKLAVKVRERFVDIRVSPHPEGVLIQTPFSGRWNALVRRYARWNPTLKGRVVLVENKRAVWELMKAVFGGRQGLNPDGKVFTIPAVEPPDGIRMGRIHTEEAVR